MTQILSPLSGRAFDAFARARGQRDNVKKPDSEWNKVKALIYKQGVVILEPDGRTVSVQPRWALAQFKACIDKLPIGRKLQELYWFTKQRPRGSYRISRARVNGWQAVSKEKKQ